MGREICLGLIHITPFQGWMDLSPKPRGVAPGCMDFAPLGLNSETGKSCIDCALLGRDYEMKEDETP
jgi:hypothetical protein